MRQMSELTLQDKMLAYHGSPYWQIILAEGLVASKAPGCAHIWLALRAIDAAQFGTVLRVDMTGLDFDWMDKDEPEYQPYWQGCYHGGNIGSDRISKEGYGA